MKVWSRLKFILKFWRFFPFIFDYFLSKEVPLWKKVLPVALITGYIVLPFDLIPEVFAIIGITDDIAVTTFILERVVRAAPQTLQEKHKLIER